MCEIGKQQLNNEARNDVAEEDDAFWYRGANKIERGREDNDIKDVIDETCAMRMLVNIARSLGRVDGMNSDVWGFLPKSQKAVTTRGSAPSMREERRALYMAQEEDGVPGNGSISASTDSLPERFAQATAIEG